MSSPMRRGLTHYILSLGQPPYMVEMSSPMRRGLTPCSAKETRLGPAQCRNEFPDEKGIDTIIRAFSILMSESCRNEFPDERGLTQCLS